METRSTPHRFALLIVILGLAGVMALALREAADISATERSEPHGVAFLPVVVAPFHASCPAPPTVSPFTNSPSWGAPIAVAPGGGAVWVANPDAGSVTLLDPLALQKEAEIAVGREPWSLAVGPHGRRLYVVDRAGGALFVVDARTRTLCARIDVGPEPGHVALSPGGEVLYVTLTSASEVAVVEAATLTVTGRIPVPPLPFAIAVHPGNAQDSGTQPPREQIYVTHLLARPKIDVAEAVPGIPRNDDRQGLVTLIDAQAQTIARQITLAPDSHGFPNLLAGIALQRDRAWVPHVRAAPALPNGVTTTVFAAVGVLDLEAGSEDFVARLLLNDVEHFGSPVNNPVAAVPAPDGQTLYIVLAGSDLVEVVDVSDPSHPRLAAFLPTGRNPRGLALSPDGSRAYVMNYLSRSVTVLDLEALALLTEIDVTTETLAPTLLQGKILFNNASDPRLSKGAWISCASCHPDGGSDGVTWMFPDGPRQTPPLWNAGQTLPWHWSAALDEAQDVEETIQIIQHGLGLAPGADPSPLGAPFAGRSPDLDALAHFLERGIRAPVMPSAAGAAAGRAVFEAAGCAACHGGPHWTTSSLTGPPGTLDPDDNGMVDELLRDVGTHNPLDVRGETGFDVPSLLGVGLTAPYFHDGSMPTLEALLRSGHPDPLGNGNGLSEEQIALLTHFLRAIDAGTTPVQAPP